MPISKPQKSPYADLPQEFKELHSENTPESWKDVFFLDLVSTGKLHIIPASQVILSKGSKEEQLLSCSIGTFKYLDQGELFQEILKGKRTFKVSPLEYEALF